MKISTPGVYQMSQDLYHADPVEGGSLSSSGARRLLPPGCPALFHYERHHPLQAANPDYDFGHLAHKLVLGAGAEVVVIDADSYRTKAAQEQRDNAYAEGKIPALAAEYVRAKAMAAALQDHPIAAALLTPGRGEPEQALIWQDGPTGVWRRALVDHLPHPGQGRYILSDYKTCRSAAPDAIMRAVHDYGYHQQADWYTDGAKALGLDEDPAMVFIFQEKQPPYLVNTIQLTGTAMLIGRDLNRQAIEIYEVCSRKNRWPGFSTDVEPIGLPPWIENAWNRGF